MKKPIKKNLNINAQPYQGNRVEKGEEGDELMVNV